MTKFFTSDFGKLTQEGLIVLTMFLWAFCVGEKELL